MIDMKVTTAYINYIYIKKMQQLVDAGIYTGKSEIVRIAVRDFIINLKDKKQLSINKPSKENMLHRETVSISIPECHLIFFDSLIEKEMFSNRSELIETVINDFFSRETALLDFLNVNSKNMLSLE